MMVAIITKFVGETRSKKAHYVAKAGTDGPTATAQIDHSLNGEDRHAAAAIALCRKMDWTGELTFGHLGNSSVFVFTGRDPEKPAYVTAPWNAHKTTPKD